MKIFFVEENGTAREVEGDMWSIYQDCILLTKEQKHSSGFVGAIDEKGRLRGTLLVHNFRGKFRNALFDFVRKYKGWDSLEKVAAQIREDLNADNA